jgi:hypothetical protein
MLVNNNKLKPYKFLQSKILQPALAKPSDLATDELVQTKKLEPLNVEHEDLQHVEFEPVDNHLTHDSIKEQMCLFNITMMCLFRTIM